MSNLIIVPTADEYAPGTEFVVYVDAELGATNTPQRVKCVEAGLTLKDFMLFWSEKDARLLLNFIFRAGYPPDITKFYRVEVLDE